MQADFTRKRSRKRFNLKTKLLNEQDRAIIAHANNLFRLLKERKTLSDIPFNSSPDNMELVFYAFEKEVYNREFSLFLSHFLSSLKPLMSIFSQSNSKETLMLLSNKLVLERHPKNELLFRFGDLADKFYLVLKGSVSIIIYKELEIKMTYEDYIAHLMRLKELKEFLLMKKIIRINNNVIKASHVNYVLSLNDREEERSPRLNIVNPNTSSEFISSKEYVDHTLPQLNNESDTEKYDIIIWVYFTFSTLGVGKTFGDIALSNPNGLRTATIICKEDSYLGSLTKPAYDSLVKDAQDKLRKARILNILSSPIFTGIRVDTFVKKYFCWFKEHELDQGTALFNQGDEKEEIFFIKEGDIDISTRLSFNELTTIIKDKGGFIDHLREKMLLYDLLIYNIPIQYTKKRTFKLFVLKEGEAVGLDDCLFNSRYFCSAICTSVKATVFSIQYSLFQRLAKEEDCIKANLPPFVEMKTEVLSNRLITLRNAEISCKAKLLPLSSSSDKNMRKPIENNSNSILLKQMLQVDQVAKIRNSNELTSRNKSESARRAPHQTTETKASLSHKKKKRLCLSLVDKNFKKMKRSNPCNSPSQPNEVIRQLAPNDLQFKKMDTLPLNIFSKRISVEETDQGQLLTPKGFSKVKPKVLSISSSCRSVKTQEQVSNIILDKIINISCRNNSHSKGIDRKGAETKFFPKEEQRNINPYNHQPGVIDFLAIDRVYESSEPKTEKQKKPKVTLIPLNILLLKRNILLKDCPI